MVQEDRFLKLKSMLLDIYEKRHSDIYCDLQAEFIGFKIKEGDKYFTMFLGQYKDLLCLTLRNDLQSLNTLRINVEDKTDQELIEMAEKCIIEQKKKYANYDIRSIKRVKKTNRKSIQEDGAINAAEKNEIGNTINIANVAEKTNKIAKPKKEDILLKDSLLNIEELSINLFPDVIDIEEYQMWSLEVGELIREIVHNRVGERDFRVFEIRMGFSDEDNPTLECIGQKEGVTRERIRQLLVRITRRTSRYVNDMLVKRFNSISSTDFLNIFFYGFCETHNFNFVKYIFECLYSRKALKYNFNQYLKKDSAARWNYQMLIKERERSESIWAKLKESIVFPVNRINKSRVFLSIEKQRTVNSEFNSGAIDSKFGKLEYESFQEKNVLEVLLQCNNVEGIKTQALKLQYEFNGMMHIYYPDIVILLKDGSVAVIEVKSPIDMVDKRVLTKYEALKNACKKAGFGYAMIDGRLVSIEEYSQKNIRRALVNEFVDYIRCEKKIGINEFNRFRNEHHIRIYDTIRAVLDNDDISFSRRPFRFYCKDRKTQ